MTTALSRRMSRALRPLFSRDSLSTFQHELDDLFHRFQAGWDGELAGADVPAVDLSETSNTLEVRMDVPGLQPNEIDIEINGDNLRVTGEHKEEKVEDDKTWHCQERRTTAFCRTVTLPARVRENEVNASCKDGVLTITLPKTEIAKPLKVAVKA